MHEKPQPEGKPLLVTMATRQPGEKGKGKDGGRGALETQKTHGSVKQNEHDETVFLVDTLLVLRMLMATYSGHFRTSYYISLQKRP